MQKELIVPIENEYHDDGFYLGDPNDAEDQAEAIRHLTVIGGMMPTFPIKE
jgi:hypothetical protein